MPAYDFRCTECGAVTEVKRSSADQSAVCCPECRAPTKRVFSPVGVHFKGTGFHNTDYKRPNAASKSVPEGTEAGACPAAKEGSSSCEGCPAAE